MELTKIEKSVIVGTVLLSLGEDKMEDYLDEGTLERLDKIFKDIEENTTPKLLRESGFSAIEKIVKDFLGEMQSSNPPHSENH